MKDLKYVVGALLLVVLVAVVSITLAENRSANTNELHFVFGEEIHKQAETVVLQEGQDLVITLENNSFNSRVTYSSSLTSATKWITITPELGLTDLNAKGELRLSLNCRNSSVPPSDVLSIHYATEQLSSGTAITGVINLNLDFVCKSDVRDDSIEEEAEQVASRQNLKQEVNMVMADMMSETVALTTMTEASSAVVGNAAPALQMAQMRQTSQMSQGISNPSPAMGRMMNPAHNSPLRPVSTVPPLPIDASQPIEDREVYATVTENQFLDTFDNPVSTFSVDVDTASYSNVRRMLRDGYLPPVDAVRTEEFVNYFKYDYAEPVDGSHPFAIHTDLAVAPWNSEHQLLRIGLQGKNIDMSQLPPSNLVFLIDVSGSMADDIELVKTAFRILTDNMRAEDRVAIVVYAGAAGVVLDSTSGNNRTTIMDALNRLRAGGSTAGGAGIQLAYDIAQKNYIPNGNNRIVVATDGDFNVGASSESELEKLITSKRDDGIFLSMLGFGQGNYHDSYMELLADKGNGNYAYIDSALEARKVLLEQLAATILTIAKDVKIQLEFNPLKVESYRLIGYENRMLAREDFDNDKKDAGEIGAGHSVTALYEIVPATDDASNMGETVYTQTTVSNAALSNDLMTIRFRYKPPHLDESRLIEKAVAYEVGEMSEDFAFASSVAEFTLLLRDSEFKAATNYDQVIERAKGSKGQDDEGYRAEFVQLVKQAQVLAYSNAYDSETSD